MSADPSLQQPAIDTASPTAEIDLDWLTLDDGETVRWASTPHKSSLIPSFTIGIPLSFVLIGIPILIASYLEYTNTNYVITSRGLYRKRGIISRDVQQIDFDKVQNISYSQTAVGSSLGYGTVEVSTAGSSGVELSFRNIPDPASVQELISREIERRDDSHGDDDADTDVVLDAILTELRGIRAALDDGTTSPEATPNQTAESPSYPAPDSERGEQAASADDLFEAAVIEPESSPTDPVAEIADPDPTSGRSPNGDSPDSDA